jgi:CheY-like chemotaxis protein
MPELILLDVMMPEMDGYTVQTQLLEDSNTKGIPIIILTAKGQLRDVFAMSANVKAYIEKPFDPKTLRQKISESLSKN